MTLEELLALPLVLEISSVSTADGASARRLSYPELGECAVEGVDVLELVDRIERLRVERLGALAPDDAAALRAAKQPLSCGPLVFADGVFESSAASRGPSEEDL